MPVCTAGPVWMPVRRGAIRIEPVDGRLRMKRSAFNGVCVFIEVTDGCVANVSLELLGKARELAVYADRDVKVRPVTALMVGMFSEDLPQMLVRHGADRVVVVRAGSF